MSEMKSSSQNTKNQTSSGKVDFMSLSNAAYGLSLFLVLASLVLVATKGFRYGIDFAGGTEFQVKFNEKPDAEAIRAKLGDIGFPSAVVQSFGGEAKELLIRLESATAPTEKEVNQKNLEAVNKIQAGLKDNFPVSEGGISVGSVGPQVGDELKGNSILAIIYSLIAIMIYVGVRFDFRFAPGAVICLIHDAIITMGVISLFNKEVNLQIVAAILTIIGYSINDTIINFDRIRENEEVYKGKSMSFIINRSVNDMLSRTILTNMTALISVAALYFIADGVIKELAFALGIGMIVGTYSSIYVSNPLVMLTERLMKKFSGVATA